MDSLISAHTQGRKHTKNINTRNHTHSHIHTLALNKYEKKERIFVKRNHP